MSAAFAAVTLGTIAGVVTYLALRMFGASHHAAATIAKWIFATVTFIFLYQHERRANRAWRRAANTNRNR